MDYTFELNNARKDEDNVKFNKKSPIVEVFSAMVNGSDLDKFGKVGDKSANYIMDLAKKANEGDLNAISEYNTLRKFVIEPTLMKEINLLGVFGKYTALGFDETPEVTIYEHKGIEANQQADGADVTFPYIVKEKYTVPTVVVSGGYAVNYRKASIGDMARENEGMEEVRKAIRNNASMYVLKKVFDAISNATGVKYFEEASGLTKAGVDALLKNIRRFGKPTVIGDYALLSEFTAWAGYVGKIDSTTITGVSQKLLDEIAENGLLGMYNGTILSELPNDFQLTTVKTDGDGKKYFDTVLPSGLGIIVPKGTTSPIQTFTRGGLTSFTGNDVANGQIMTRFDLEIGVDVAKGQEYKIGLIHDTSLDDLN